MHLPISSGPSPSPHFELTVGTRQYKSAFLFAACGGPGHLFRDLPKLICRRTLRASLAVLSSDEESASPVQFCSRSLCLVVYFPTVDALLSASTHVDRQKQLCDASAAHPSFHYKTLIRSRVVLGPDFLG